MTPRLPYPVVGGDRLRIYRICAELSKWCDITLLSLCDSRDEMSMSLPQDGVFRRVERVYLPPWRSRLNVLAALPTRMPLQVAYYRCRSLARRVRDELQQHDLALAHLLRTESYIARAPIPTMVELTDAISLNYTRSRKVVGMRGLRPMIYALEQGRIAAAEAAMPSRHALVGLISEVDAEYLYGKPLPANVVVFGNGVDTATMRAEYRPAQTRDIAFIGNMNTMQNMDAARWFAESVLPILRAAGDFRLRVIGHIPQRSREALERFPGVLVTGEVVSVPEAAAGCFAAACSVRVGAGVQNKVLEYLALGLPTVTSSVGAEGLEGIDGVHYQVADDAAQVARRLVELHDRPEAALALSVAGRALVESRYGWSAVLRPLVEALQRCLAGRATTGPAASSGTA